MTEQAPASVKAAAIAWHLGQHLAVGAITATVVALWLRRGPRSSVASVAALGVLALLVAWVVAQPDVVVAASKLPLPPLLAQVLLTTAVAASVPASFMVARLLCRWRFGRVPCAVMAVALLVCSSC